MDITDGDRVAAIIGEDITEDVVVRMGVAKTKGDDVYAHCVIVVPDTSVD